MISKKQHKGESLSSFKKRRKASNSRRRTREHGDACPICGGDMKEFVTMYKCRNLKCRFKRMKPPKGEG